MLINLSRNGVQRIFPQRPKEAHKGMCGRIYILAGSREMVGAGILASWGALRSGAGLVRLATVKSQQAVVGKRAPLEITTQLLPEDKNGHISKGSRNILFKGINNFKADVLAIGPGLGLSSSIRSLVPALLAKAFKPIVLDADGLNAGGKALCARPETPLVITPHPGELSRLLNVSTQKIQGNRPFYARLAARRFRCICLLKGKNTLVSDGKKVWRNTTGNSGMATGGTGDVLTGMISGLWGQFKFKNMDSALKSTLLGAYFHGLAGDIASRKKGIVSMIATDLVNCIPDAIKFVMKRRIV